MTQEQGGFTPIINANKLSWRSRLEAFFNSYIGRTNIHIGTLESDGKTVDVRGGTIQADNVQAKPGDRVITYEE